MGKRGIITGITGPGCTVRNNTIVCMTYGNAFRFGPCVKNASLVRNAFWWHHEHGTMMKVQAGLSDGIGVMKWHIFFYINHTALVII